jgi:hypothetical protein
VRTAKNDGQVYLILSVAVLKSFQKNKNRDDSITKYTDKAFLINGLEQNKIYSLIVLSF